ncbi:hypothetical protein B0A55_06637 [Friedmanniomyces simplex]|uniref:Nucleotide-diphospho-sugar transferase domain-containing protein n=1 Tax=Friedmanniomyces simplex TaxID=329884 RepID=A0A4U0XML7_9PEZI|nr:hypothetical protein B0A55_06637 [Friedmanniomyces simplex]
MRWSQSHLAVGAFLICTAALLRFSAPPLRAYDWTSLRWRTGEDSYNATEVLLAENRRLLQALALTTAELEKEKLAESELRRMVNSTATQLEQVKQSTGDGTAAGATGHAYVFYATSDPYACSVLVNIHCLRNLLNSTLPIHVLASSDVTEPYMAAFRTANATVHVEQAPALKNPAAGYYQDCMLKLLAFKMQLLDPTLKRVLAFDSDQLILRNLDHLFTGLPAVDLAAPRAYWLAKDFLASTFLMINLSDRLWRTVKSALDKVEFNKFDMDLINDLLGDSVMMLSGEYVTLNSHWEDWNLPRWYHPLSRLNMTTVEMWNELAQAGISKRGNDEALPKGVNPNTSYLRASEDAAPPSKPPHPLTAVPLLPSARPALPPHLLGSPSAFPKPETPPPPPPPPIEPMTHPRFPASHPLTLELYRLQDAAAVIHFTAQGKPWMKVPSDVRAARPDAHPVLAGQFGVWREMAGRVCPAGGWEGKG